MPLLDLVDTKGKLPWDASCRLFSTIIVPEEDQADLRSQYEAKLRVDNARPLPNARKLLSRSDRERARQFQDQRRVDLMIQTRRKNTILAGLVLWNLKAANDACSEWAKKDRIEYAIDQVSISDNKLGTKSDLEKAWRQFRSVIHWCAALAYEYRILGRPFADNSSVGYDATAALIDFLYLAQEFEPIADEFVYFEPEGEPYRWKLQTLPEALERQPGWPPRLRLSNEFRPSEGISAHLETYRPGYRRPWPWRIPGPGLRSRLSSQSEK